MITIRKSLSEALLRPAVIAFYPLFLCLGMAARAQPVTIPDSVSYTAASTADDNLLLRLEYLRAIGESSGLYNGVQYIRNGEKTEGFPFFESEQPLPGSVNINGVAYPGILLQLDLATGQLITENFTATSLFVIEPTVVDSFVIGGHQFLTLKGDKPGFPRPGYYERLPAGNDALYIRWGKKLQPRPDYALSVYTGYDEVYLVKDGTVHSIANRKALMQWLGDGNGELKKFIRTQNLNFKKDLAGASAALFRHYQNMNR